MADSCIFAFACWQNVKYESNVGALFFRGPYPPIIRVQIPIKPTVYSVQLGFGKQIKYTKEAGDAH